MENGSTHTTRALHEPGWGNDVHLGPEAASSGDRGREGWEGRVLYTVMKDILNRIVEVIYSFILN